MLKVCLYLSLSLVLQSDALSDEIPRFISYSDSFYRIFPAKPDVSVVVDSERDGNNLSMTEGPSWLDDSLYFSDQPGGLHSLRPNGMWSLINHGGWTCGTAPLPNGNLAVCYVESTTVVEITPSGRIIGTMIDNLKGKPLFGNPNDIVVDSKGGFYVTITSFFGKDVEKNTGVIYRSPDSEVVMVIDKNEYGMPNGLCLSPDESVLYLSDSSSFTIWAYDVMSNGRLRNKRFFGMIKPPGDSENQKYNGSAADGMTCDRNGNVFATSRFGLHTYSKDGKYLGLVQFHASPSNCVIGGKDMTTLFVTCRTRVYAIQMKSTLN